MFIGLLELRQSIEAHSRLYLFSVFVILTWAVWGLKVILSRRYKPWTEPHAATTTVVIPVVDEPLDLFREVLQRIVFQGPTQVVVVINGPQNPQLEAVCEEFAPEVEWTWTPIAGKRNAVKVGTELAVGEIVVLVDSDTVWTKGTLTELVKPFADPGVGGVTTRQRILDPERCFLTRWADWIENSRALYSMPAQSVLGTVGCLPGRTIAFRRVILERVMHDFMNQKFLGIFLEVSDDRTLTNLTLKLGFRTVYQATSLVYTDAPLQFKKMVKQQFRWARGSQYNTMRMLPWMIARAPLLAFFFVADIVLPFMWVCSASAWVARSTDDSQHNLYSGMLEVRTHALLVVIGVTVLTSTLSMALRQARHLHEVPGDMWRLPGYILFSTVVLMPVRLYGFLRLGHNGGWGTRADAYAADSVEEGTAPTPDVVSSVHVPSTSAGASAAAGTPTQVALAHPETKTDPHAQAALPHRSAQVGDPRALIPYLIAAAIVITGVMYDIRPV